MNIKSLCLITHGKKINSWIRPIQKLLVPNIELFVSEDSNG